MRILLLAAPLLSAPQPLSFECRVAANGDGEAAITNHSTVPLAAYVFEVLREPCNPIEADQHDIRGYDAATAPDGKALPPSASRAHTLGASHCNKTGVNSPATAVFKAALFEDGTTYGDRQWAETLLQHRSFCARRIDGAIHALTSGTGGKTTRPEYLRLLSQARTSSGQPGQNFARVEFRDVDPYDLAARHLTAARSDSLVTQVQDLLATLQAMRGKLQILHPSK